MISALPQFRGRVAPASGMLGVVVLHLGVAVEAQSYCVIRRVITTPLDGNDVVHFDLDAAGLVTEAAMPLTGNEKILRDFRGNAMMRKRVRAAGVASLLLVRPGQVVGGPLSGGWPQARSDRFGRRIGPSATIGWRIPAAPTTATQPPR